MVTSSPGARPSDSPLLILGLALSASTGLVDAVSVLGLGRVFTANMTGNVIFLGTAVSGAEGFLPLLYLCALATFLIGALVGGRVGAAHTKSLRSWLNVAAAVETSLLWTAALVAFFATLQPTSGAGLYAIVALTALAMGFRNATIRQLKLQDVTTTVLTLTLTGLAADSRLAGGTNANWQRRVASVVALFAGAALGSILTLSVGIAMALLTAGLLTSTATLLCSARLRS